MFCIQQNNHADSALQYRMAGNIGGEFNLADWRMSERSAKFKSAKYSVNAEFADLVPSLPYGAGNGAA